MSHDESMNYRIRRAFGHRLIPLLKWVRRVEVARIEAVLGEARRLCAEWHRLAKIDHEADVDFDDPQGAGHLAYLAYEEEVNRLRA